MNRCSIPEQHVVGYELTLAAAGRRAVTDADLEALVSFVAEQVNDDERGWLLRDKTLFLEAVPAMLSTDALHKPAARAHGAVH